MAKSPRRPAKPTSARAPAAHRIGADIPTRPWTVLAQDPRITDAKGNVLTTTVDLPAERLERGPKGHRVHAMDYDASTGHVYSSRTTSRSKTWLLFPGAAQWENWRYALSQKANLELLSRVNVYKVGHHGRRNATPKSLWNTLANRGGKTKAHRLTSVMSTKDDVHGESEGTAVPRKTLVSALEKDSRLVDTRTTVGDTLCRLETVRL